MPRFHGPLSLDYFLSSFSLSFFPLLILISLCVPLSLNLCVNLKDTPFFFLLFSLFSLYAHLLSLLSLLTFE